MLRSGLAMGTLRPVTQLCGCADMQMCWTNWGHVTQCVHHAATWQLLLYCLFSSLEMLPSLALAAMHAPQDAFLGPADKGMG